LPEIWEEFLFILGEEAQWEAVDGQLNSCGGEDEGAPRVLPYLKRLVECSGEGIKIRGVRGGGGGSVGDGQRDGASGVDSSRETQGEAAVGLAEDASSDVRKGSGNGGSVWMWVGGLARSKEASLGS